MMRKILALALALWAAPASAQIVGTLPFTLQNGTIADANQVMSDLNTIVSGVNANAASAGVNSNITALNGLTTPLVYTSGGSSAYIGGTSSGSANAQVVASPIPSGFTLIAGKSITFLAGFTNTGATQLNVASTGLINVFRQGVSGPVALSGGEIAVGNLVTAIYDGTEYQIANASPQSLVPACTVIDWNGANGAPSGYLLLNGQNVSRTTYATLFGCISVQGVAATTTVSSASVVVPNSALFQIGWSVGGSNVTCNSTITAIPDSTHITISANAGASGATTLTIGPYGQGDCSTTFGVGDYRGRVAAMRDNTNLVLVASTCANANTIGVICGVATQTLTTGNLPPYTPTVASNTLSVAVPLQGSLNVGAGGVSVSAAAQGNNQTGATQVNVSPSGTIFMNAQGGTSTPFSNVQPVVLVDKYIKF